MKKWFWQSLALAFLTIGLATVTAVAAPPTAQPSPGYDLRLEQSRRHAPRIVQSPAYRYKHHRRHKYPR
jgi:hypothetical protein